MSNYLRLNLSFSSRKMDISLSGVKSNDGQRETAEHIWKMLDELAVSDPDSYNSFIKKTLSEVPPGMRSGVADQSVKLWKVFKVKCAHPVAKFLAIKFWSDPSVLINKDTQLPVKSSWVPQMESDTLSVTVYLSPKLISSIEKEKKALPELIAFVCDEVEKLVELKCQSDAVIVVEQNEMPIYENVEKQGGDVYQNSQKQNTKVLIEELSSSSVTGNLPVPHFHFEVQSSCIVYQIELPMLECLSEYDLTVEDDSLSLSIPGFYNFRHKHNLSVDSDQVKAKFLRKRKMLKVVIPLLDNVA